jgi:hypothetical protein
MIVGFQYVDLSSTVVTKARKAPGMTPPRMIDPSRAASYLMIVPIKHNWIIVLLEDNKTNIAGTGISPNSNVKNR